VMSKGGQRFSGSSPLLNSRAPMSRAEMLSAFFPGTDLVDIRFRHPAFGIVVDWDVLADAIVTRDYDAWPLDLLQFVSEASARDDIVRLSARVGLDPKVLAMLLLAKRDEELNRNASRVARHISALLSKKALAALQRFIAKSARASD